MVLLASVPARMLGGGRVAATDVTALRAPAQMEPPAATGLAFRTTGPTGRNVRVDSRHGAQDVTSPDGHAKHFTTPIQYVNRPAFWLKGNAARGRSCVAFIPAGKRTFILPAHTGNGPRT